MERYELQERIGKGTYGTVYRARDKQSGDSVALKTIDLEDEEGIPSTAIREIALLKWLKHPNIVQLHDVIHIFNKLYMVFELMELDLKHYIEVCPNGLQMITIKSLLYQLLQGLAFCHKHRILHRDLKPANLLLNRAGILKVADFGLARTFAMPVTSLKHEVITLWYRAPELLLGATNYSTEVDLWSVGCIFAEMLTSMPIFSGSTDESQIELIFRTCGKPEFNNEAYSPNTPQTNPQYATGNLFKSLPLFEKYHDLIYRNQNITATYDRSNILSVVPSHSKDQYAGDLLAKLLDLDPTSRITADQAMQHPFFNELKHKQRRSSAQQSQQHTNNPPSGQQSGVPNGTAQPFYPSGQGPTAGGNYHS